MSKSLSIAILLATALSSCKTIKQSTTSDHITNNSHTLVIKDSLQIGWQFGTTIPVSLLDELPPNTPIVIADTTNNGQYRGQIRFLKDELGNLHAYCDERDQIIRNLRRELLNQQTSTSIDSITVERPWYLKYFLQWLVASFLLGLSTPFLFRKLLP